MLVPDAHVARRLRRWTAIRKYFAIGWFIMAAGTICVAGYYAFLARVPWYKWSLLVSLTMLLVVAVGAHVRRGTFR